MLSRWQKVLKEYVEAFVVAFILAMIIRTFVVQAFKIPSGSMLDTLLIGAHLLVNKFIFGVKIPFWDRILVPIDDPERGDIIVFKFPEDPSKDFIKRVIGTPGDTVEIRNKVVVVNGQPLEEPYTQHTSPAIIPGLRDNMSQITVPENSFFVMGDNRDESYDSRFWGFVDRKAIKGKAFIIYWSWKSLTDIRWSRIGDLVE